MKSIQISSGSWLALVLTAAGCWTAQAQDQRDEDIFGEKPAAEGKKPADGKSRTQNLVDTLQIGGRLEVRSSTGQEEQQKLPDASFSQVKTADVYFDTRPNRDMRVFLRQRFEELTPAVANTTAAGTTPAVACSSCVQSKIDELWFKWNIDDAVFMTLGKQHLKWGSSRFWNPTDFTARESRDPFALFDRRLGSDLLKIHIPQEKQGHNYYAIFQFDDMERNADLKFALRGEFSVASSAELALTAEAGSRQPQRLGVDLSSALGPFDGNIEAAATHRVQKQFFEGTLDPSTFQFPQAVEDEDRWFYQVSGGLRQTVKYSDDDNVSWGLEYFWNEFGYEERELELYSLVLRQSSPLYAGRRYAGLYVALQNPGSWNETSFYANALGNLSDQTTVSRLTATWEVVDAATLEVYVSRCFGEFGELCFKIPESYKALANVPGIAEPLRQALTQLPTRRTVFTAGAGLSLVF